MMDIGEKIREARKAKGLTLEALANQVDTDTGNLSRLERGKQGASQDLLKRILGVLDMQVTHVIPQTYYNTLDVDNVTFQDIETNSARTAPHSLFPPRKYPVVSWYEAEQWALDRDSFFVEEGCEEHSSGVDPVQDAFWLKVAGDAMASTGNPSFPEGCLILVEPRSQLISGKYYAFSINRSGDYTFKQYIEDAGHKYLRPLNNNYRTIELKDEHFLIGRIIDVKMTGP